MLHVCGGGRNQRPRQQNKTLAHFAHSYWYPSQCLLNVFNEGVDKVLRSLWPPMVGGLRGPRYQGLQFVFALSCSSAGVPGSLVSSQRLLPYAESRSPPRLTTVQNLERKQDLTSLTPKGGFVAAQPVKGIGPRVRC